MYIVHSFRVQTILFIYYIQDIAHNFDNIFISVGFSRKLTDINMFMIKITQLSVTNNTDSFAFFLFFIFANYYCRGLSRSIIQTSRSLGHSRYFVLSLNYVKTFFLSSPHHSCPHIYKTKWQVLLFSFLYTCFVHFNNVIIVAKFKG